MLKTEQIKIMATEKEKEDILQEAEKRKLTTSGLLRVALEKLKDDKPSL